MEDPPRRASEVRDVAFGRLHRPDGAHSGPLRGVVLVHDVWGPSPHSLELAGDVAREGFAVLEIDLYREARASGIFEVGPDPGTFIRGLSDPDVLADLDAAAAWFSDEACGGAAPCVMGVCMGGTYALLAACASNRFAAAAACYGILSYDEGMLAPSGARDFVRKPASPIERAANLGMPLLACFGAEDEFVPIAHVEALRSGLAASGQPFEVQICDGAGHAFLNRTRAAAYRPRAAAAVWRRLVPFLRERLQPGA